jgi:hypothetical protein
MIELAATIFCLPFIILAVCFGVIAICWIIAIPLMIGSAVLKKIPTPILVILALGILISLMTYCA